MKRIKNTINKWLFIPGHPHRIFIIGGSGSGKKNALLNLIIVTRNNIVWKYGP